MKRLFIVNLPGPYLIRKTPRIYPTEYLPERWQAAAVKARALDLAAANVTMTLNGTAWLLSANVLIEAETPKEAETIAATKHPTFKRPTNEEEI